MISIRRYAAAAVMLGACGAARAQGENAMLSLAQSHNCMSCHSVTRMSMGPAFRSVAEKYAGVEGAHAVLARKIVEGGAGVWGPVPMPANTQLSADQASALAGWILTLR